MCVAPFLHGVVSEMEGERILVRAAVERILRHLSAVPQVHDAVVADPSPLSHLISSIKSEVDTTISELPMQC